MTNPHDSYLQYLEYLADNIKQLPVNQDEHITTLSLISQIGVVMPEHESSMHSVRLIPWVEWSAQWLLRPPPPGQHEALAPPQAGSSVTGVGTYASLLAEVFSMRKSVP